MIVSEARIAANRANALKSTGPKSAEGKERSRCNAVKHGMTGEGVALSSEDSEAIERRLAGFLAQHRPATEGGPQPRPPRRDALGPDGAGRRAGGRGDLDERPRRRAGLRRGPRDRGR